MYLRFWYAGGCVSGTFRGRAEAIASLLRGLKKAQIYHVSDAPTGVLLTSLNHAMPA
jgi:hypothetical protein